LAREKRKWKEHLHPHTPRKTAVVTEQAQARNSIHHSHLPSPQTQGTHGTNHPNKKVQPAINPSIIIIFTTPPDNFCLPAANQ
jgi:hypothetical protein